jgi:hypothetical protein
MTRTERGGIVEDGTANDGRFGWRGWLAVLAGLATVGAFLLGIGALGRLAGLGAGTHPRPASTTSRLTNDGYAYWYCWDVGAPRPHHIGAAVQGDHVCTDTELQQVTETP